MDETVLCIHADAAKTYNPQNIVSAADHVWLPRSQCETDERYRQVIPYCAVSWSGKWLLYDRAGSESRLHGLSSIGVGGHISEGETVYCGMRRELNEELGLTKWSRLYVGNIIHDDTPVSRVHIGVAYIVIAEHMPSPKEELLNPRWLSLDECSSHTLENWSKSLIDMLRRFDCR